MGLIRKAGKVLTDPVFWRVLVGFALLAGSYFVPAPAAKILLWAGFGACVHTVIYGYRRYKQNTL